MFGEPSKIASLDIGNFGSAFVKVEVGHKNKKHEWFALLPQTKFMDSLDSRNGVGIRKVSFLKFSIIFTSGYKILTIWLYFNFFRQKICSRNFSLIFYKFAKILDLLDLKKYSRWTRQSIRSFFHSR